MAAAASAASSPLASVARQDQELKLLFSQTSVRSEEEQRQQLTIGRDSQGNIVSIRSKRDISVSGVLNDGVMSRLNTSLPHLAELKLYGHRLSGPATLTALPPNLRELDLCRADKNASDGLTGELVIGLLPKTLDYFDITNNNFATPRATGALDWPALSTLGALTTFFVADNQLTGPALSGAPLDRILPPRIATFCIHYNKFTAPAEEIDLSLAPDSLRWLRLDMDYSSKFAFHDAVRLTQRIRPRLNPESRALLDSILGAGKLGEMEEAGKRAKERQEAKAVVDELDKARKDLAAVVQEANAEKQRADEAEAENAVLKSKLAVAEAALATMKTNFEEELKRKLEAQGKSLRERFINQGLAGLGWKAPAAAAAASAELGKMRHELTARMQERDTAVSERNALDAKLKLQEERVAEEKRRADVAAMEAAAAEGALSKARAEFEAELKRKLEAQEQEYVNGGVAAFARAHDVVNGTDQFEMVDEEDRE